MLIVHAGRQPEIHPTSWVAPDATIAGDVAIGRECRVLWGAGIIGEGGGKIRIGRGAIVMENAVIRATARQDCAIGDPAQILPPDRHGEIWALQKPLDFPGFVYGFPREAPEPMRRITGRLAATLDAHRADRAAEG